MVFSRLFTLLPERGASGGISGLPLGLAR